MDVHNYTGSPKLIFTFIHILLFANICIFQLPGSLLNFHCRFVDDLLVRGRFGSNREWQAHCTNQDGGELRRSLSNLLLTAGSAVSSDQLTQGFILFHAENLQGWRMYHLSRWLVPLSSWGKRFSLYPIWSSLVSTSACCVSSFCLASTGKSPSPSPCWSPCRWWRAAARWPLKLFLLQAVDVPVPQHLLTEQVLQLQPSWCLLLNSFQFVTIFPILWCVCWGGKWVGPKLDMVFRSGSNQAKGDNYVPWSPGYVPINVSQEVTGCWLSCKTTTFPVYVEHPVSVTRLVMKLSIWIFKMGGCCRLSGKSMHFELIQPQQAAVVLKWWELWRLFIRDERKAVA